MIKRMFIYIAITAFIFMLSIPDSLAVTREVSESNIVDSIANIEAKLAANSTSIEQELSKSIADYDHQLALTSPGSVEADKLRNLKSAAESMRYDYLDYVAESGIFSRATKLNPIGDPIVSPCVSIPAAVAAASAYFKVNGYSLADELLLFSTSKANDGHEAYQPQYGYLTKKSPVISKIKNLDQNHGSDVFPNEGDTVQKDLFFAIHKFNWSRSSGYLIIDDVYDYSIDESPYENITDIAVDLMVVAQSCGVIKPYNLLIFIEL